VFTPTKIKADILFALSLVVVFGFNIPTGISAAIIGSAGLIAALLNLGDSLAEKYDPKLISGFASEVHTLESDVEKVLPELLPVLAALPGKIGQEVAEAIAKIEAEQKNKPEPKA
jgi:hypothetical protein